MGGRPPLALRPDSAKGIHPFSRPISEPIRTLGRLAIALSGEAGLQSIFTRIPSELNECCSIGYRRFAVRNPIIRLAGAVLLFPGRLFHVRRYDSDHYSDHRSAGRIQRSWRRALLRHRLCGWRRAWSGPCHRGDSGSYRANLNQWLSYGAFFITTAVGVAAAVASGETLYD